MSIFQIQCNELSNITQLITLYYIYNNYNQKKKIIIFVQLWFNIEQIKYTHQVMLLSEAYIGRAYIVVRTHISGMMRRRLQDLGIIPGTVIVLEHRSSPHGLSAYRVRGSTYALRESDANKIEVQPIG